MIFLGMINIKQTSRCIYRDSYGFTFIEIIAVLLLIGIMAAVAVPKYLEYFNMQDEARKMVAMGQIAEVKGRLAQSLARYMLENEGAKPINGADLVSYANGSNVNTCPANPTTESDFEFKCTGGIDTAKTVVIDVLKVKGAAVNQSGIFTY